MTYIGAESTPLAAGFPVVEAWKLSGENIIVTFDTFYLIQRVNSAARLEEEEKRSHCTGTVEVPASATIYQQKN